MHLEIPPISDVERRDFDVRAFARRWGLDATKGGGAHMWREVWSEGVSKIYADILSELIVAFGFFLACGACLLTAYCFARRGGRAEVWETAQGGPVCGAQADETLCLVVQFCVVGNFTVNRRSLTMGAWALSLVLNLLPRLVLRLASPCPHPFVGIRFWTVEICPPFFSTL